MTQGEEQPKWSNPPCEDWSRLKLDEKYLCSILEMVIRFLLVVAPGLVSQGLFLKFAFASELFLREESLEKLINQYSY